MFWFIVVGIIVYMVTYALEWSWNYVVLAPMIVENTNQAKLRQQSEDISALTEKLEASSGEAQRKIETRIAFASLMEEGKSIEEKLLINPNPHEHNAISESFNGWINRAAEALAESGFQTDATLFRHSGERPTDVQQNAIVPFYLKMIVWKHYDITRASIYLAKLQEIIERKNL
jgi:hypothetical protein